MEFIRTLFFYFIVYSFLGWIIEGVFNLCTRGHFIKENFLFLPLKPMYGIAAILLISLKAFVPFWLFLIGAFIIPTLVEYFTAFILYHNLNLKYWDYSHCKYQVSGYICLRFSLYWVILSLALIYGLHPYIVILYNTVYGLWYYFFPIILPIFITDFILTLRFHRTHLVHSRA